MNNDVADQIDEIQTLALEKLSKLLVLKKSKVVNYSDALVFNQQGQLLLLLRAKETSFEPYKWCLPGGHVDPGEDANIACLRELEEETGIISYKAEKCHNFKDDKVNIDYFYCYVKDFTFNIVLDHSEHLNFKWIDRYDLDSLELIKGLKEQLDKIEFPFEIIKKAFDQDIISDDEYIDIILKSGKAAQIGEVRTWHGKKFQKTVSGWIFVNDPKNKSQLSEDPKEKKKQKKISEVSDEEIKTHATNSSKEDLERTVKESPSPKLRKAAHDELKRRESEEAGVEKKQPKKESIKDKVKNWHKKQEEFYKSGELEANSEQRNNLSSLIAKKRKGIIKGLKAEVKEFKEAGKGLRKIFSGNSNEISDHERKAMKQVAIHLSMVIGSTAIGLATGGSSVSMAGIAKALAFHYFEHTGIVKVGHAALFAKAEDTSSINNDQDDDVIFDTLINDMVKFIKSGHISNESWQKIGDSSSDTLNELYDLKDDDMVDTKKTEKKDNIITKAISYVKSLFSNQDDKIKKEDEAFDIVKKAFDNNEISEDSYLNYYFKYQEIVKNRKNSL